MKNIRTQFSIILLIVLVSSCNKQKQPDEPVSGDIIISAKQFETDSMELGNISKELFTKVVKCQGMVDVLPSGLAVARIPIPGTVSQIRVNSGQMVARGQVLFEITGKEFIELQKNTAEASLLLKKTSAEFKRIQALYKEEIVSEKDFQQIKSEYASARAAFEAYKLQCNAAGINVSEIEKGNYKSSYEVKSPISGELGNMKIKLGAWVNDQTELPEITDISQLQIQLSVFASDINNVKSGQEVKVKMSHDDRIFTAKMKYVGSVVNEKTNAIDCYATISNISDTKPVRFGVVNGEIIVQKDSVWAVPTEAILKSGNQLYLLELQKKDKEGYSLRQKEIQTGREQNGYTELLTKPDVKEIMTQGLYNIQLK